MIDQKQKKLRDYISTTKGFAFKSSWYSDKGKPIVKVSNFTENSIDTSNLIFIPDEIAEQYKKVTLLKDDVVIQTVGSYPSNPQSVVGKVIRVPASASGSLLNQNAVKVKPNTQLHNKFLYYLLKNDDFKYYILGTARGAANQASITLESIYQYQFPLPPLPTQLKIAVILSAYDDLIENNTRRIKILEEMVQAIYREWFVHFRFPRHEGVRMVESELGPIPEGWEVRKLGDIAEEVRRNVEPNNLDPNTPYVGLEHIPRKSIALPDWGLAKEVQSTKHQFFSKEILFGKIRPYFHKVVIAPIDGVCSSDAIVIRSKKPEYFGLTLFCVSSEDFVNHATQTSQGTKMPRANWNVLINYPVIVPPKSLLDQFNSTSSDMIDLITTKIFQNRSLNRIRDLLLPKLISGELDVSELDIMIPEAMT